MIDIALPSHAKVPKVDGVSLRVFWYPETSFRAGVEVVAIDDVSAGIYSVEKTIADCFKYRNKIGSDVAIEALREAWRGKRCTMDEFWRFAKVCRVANVMRPYLEMLT